jgi:hypothetical protein
MMLIRILDWLDWCSWERIERGKFIGEAKILKIIAITKLLHNISLTCSTLKMRTIWYGSIIAYVIEKELKMWICGKSEEKDVL